MSYSANAHIELTEEELSNLMSAVPKRKKVLQSVVLKLGIAFASLLLSKPQTNKSELKQRINDFQHQLEALDTVEIKERKKKDEVEEYEKAVWTLRDGTKIPISSMDDEHIMNCIWLLQRNAVKNIVLADKQVKAKDLLDRTSYRALVYHAKKRKLVKPDKFL